MQARRRALLIVLMAAALLTATGSVSAQSLGDLAKKTQTDRDKRAGTAAKVYSDKDLRVSAEVDLPPAPTVPGKWRRHETISKMDDSRTVGYQLHAEAGPGGPVVVGASCISGMTGPITVAAITTVKTVAPGKSTVRVRFDNEPVQIESWSSDSEFDSLVPPNMDAFLRRVAFAQRLLFQYSAYREGPQTIEFDVRGFDYRGLLAECPQK